MTDNQYQAIKNLILCLSFILFSFYCTGWLDLFYAGLSTYTFICWWYYDRKVSKGNSNDN